MGCVHLFLSAYVSTHLVTKGWHGLSSSIIFHLFFFWDRISHLSQWLEPIWQALGIYPSLPSYPWVREHASVPRFLYRSWGSKLMLVQQALYQVSHLPGPGSSLLIVSEFRLHTHLSDLSNDDIFPLTFHLSLLCHATTNSLFLLSTCKIQNSSDLAEGLGRKTPRRWTEQPQVHFRENSGPQCRKPFHYQCLSDRLLIL